MKLKPLQSTRAIAPASVANVAVGFDILGFACDILRDEVMLTRRSDNKFIVHSKTPLPLDTDQNTASVALQHACQTHGIDVGFDIHITKGIPLSSGLGGSAASAVAALVALNELLATPLELDILTQSAIIGEIAASGEPHGDNVIPCLYGGLTLIHSLTPVQVTRLPTPDIFCVIIHPDLVVRTAEARAALNKHLPLKQYIQQSSNLANFISSLYRNDLKLLHDSANDVVIEPQRAKFIKNFYPVKNAALSNNALCCSISGSGPTLFALTENETVANTVKDAMLKCFHQANIKATGWVRPFNSTGARSIPL